VLPCNARDKRCAYAGEVPARAKYTGTNSVERDVGMLENTISAPTETRTETTHTSRDKASDSRCNIDRIQNTFKGRRKIISFWFVWNRRWPARYILDPDCIFNIPPVVIHKIGG
jgi:hypothetical protein